MTRLFAGLVLSMAIAAPAMAALKEGVVAPAFTLPAALDGKDFTYDLSAELKKGPTVVYFYPAAFSSGCSVEAHEFAENIDKFKAMGAGVIGVSGDNIKTLEDFSKKDCASKFPVAADPAGDVIAKYDAKMGNPLFKTAMKMKYKMDNPSDRTSYLIAPDGTIIATYSALDASKHVSTMLAALKTWRETHKG